MSGCTLRLAKNSPLRTTLIDETTGQAVYQIDTPVRIARSVTRIRKFDSPPQPRLHWDDDADSDSGDDVTDKGKKKSKKDKRDTEEEGDEADTKLPQTSDEIARIYWKWFSPDRIVFRGKITTRDVFLPKCGKMKGWANSCLFRRAPHRELAEQIFEMLGATCLLDQTGFSTDGRWGQWG